MPTEHFVQDYGTPMYRHGTGWWLCTATTTTTTTTTTTRVVVILAAADGDGEGGGTQQAPSRDGSGGHSQGSREAAARVRTDGTQTSTNRHQLRPGAAGQGRASPGPTAADPQVRGAVRLAETGHTEPRQTREYSSSSTTTTSTATTTTTTTTVVVVAAAAAAAAVERCRVW